MATTAKGTPYVESSDLVADYPTVSLALAEHIDDVSKVSQIVRATDATSRTTTSLSYVDVTGMSVSITPQKTTNLIIVVAIGYAITQSSIDGQNSMLFQITDNANSELSGAQNMRLGLTNFTGTGTRSSFNNLNVWGYVSPATISPVTYKLRFRVDDASVTGILRNDVTTGQMYAIEVSA